MNPRNYATYIPTEDQIREGCERIKAGWSEAEADSRDMYDKPEFVELTHYSLSELLAAV